MTRCESVAADLLLIFLEFLYNCVFCNLFGPCSFFFQSVAIKFDRGTCKVLQVTGHGFRVAPGRFCDAREAGDSCSWDSFFRPDPR
jgi:hypothetical protein